MADKRRSFDFYALLPASFRVQIYCYSRHAVRESQRKFWF